MKLVHRQDDDAESIADLLQKAREAERAADWPGAERRYHLVLKREGSHLQAFQRLMIVYRKQKMYRQELAIINKAIAAYTKLYEPRAAHNKKVQSLSARINKAFGMTDRRGRSLYEPGPVAVWKKRKALVEKRMSK